jgi:Cyclic nucleotide-binding domain
MSAVKVFKKGEYIFKEGDRATCLYMLQGGSVSLQVTRTKQTIELFTSSGTQIIGEHALSGATAHPHSALVTSETKVVELPLDTVKVQIESGLQMQKLLVKGLVDKLKVLMRDCQSMKLERDNTPCPPDQCAKIFGTLYHVARVKGEPDKAKPEIVKVNWLTMRQYAQRIFLESPKRLQMAVNILVKLGWAKYHLEKPEDNPEGPEEIVAVSFFDLPVVEQFFEFFQFYHFKGGKQELLKTDDRVMQLTKVLIDLGAQEKMDRRNSVRLPYVAVVEKVKSAMGLQLNNDHWAMLELKGLLVKRQTVDAGVVIEFDFKEYERMEKIWRILRETERWNEKGIVDPNEPVEAKKVQKSGVSCPQCNHAYETAPKFCSECGHKFTAAA